jgi:L-iditol 2-dehydrogenase
MQNDCWPLETQSKPQVVSSVSSRSNPLSRPLERNHLSARKSTCIPLEKADKTQNNVLMKALVKRGASVSVEFIPQPELRSSHDVLIQVKRAGLCRTDLYVAEGKIQSLDPLILGHEFSGVVEAIGQEVSRFKPGDRVTVNPQIACGKCSLCLSQQESHCQNNSFLGINHQGAFAEYIVVPDSLVYALPDHMDFKTGAYTEPVAASLAVLKANIQPHEKGLIYGSNRISQLTFTILKAYGFTNLAVYDVEGHETLTPDFYDFIIETLITTPELDIMLQALHPGGKIIFKSRQHHPISLTLSQILKKEPVFYAVNYASFAEAIALMAFEQIDFSDILGDEFDLEEFEQVFMACKQKESRKLFFRF